MRYIHEICSLIGKLNAVKISSLPNLAYACNVIQIKIPGRFFLVQIDKEILKFIWKAKRNRIPKTNLEKNKVEEPILPDFKIYYKGTAIKTLCYWQRTDIGKWNTIESRNRTTHI